MLRRHLIALGGLLMAGLPITRAAELNVGELLDELGHFPPVPLPARLIPEHVHDVREMTRRIGQGDTSSADPAMATATAVLARRLLDVPGPESVCQALKVAVSELHIEAGWAALDAGLYQHALLHFARALELATDTGDIYLQALSLGYGGQASVEHGHPDDGLKMLQSAQVAAWRIPSDDQRVVVVGEVGRNAAEAEILANTATALSLLGRQSEASRMVAKGRDLWTPTPADVYGDPDRVGARVELARGRLEVAHTLATASLRRWDGVRQTSHAQTRIVLATLTVTAGEWKNLQAVHDTITAVGRLRSVRIRRQLTPLIDALDARPNADTAELARMARKIAA